MGRQQAAELRQRGVELLCSLPAESARAMTQANICLPSTAALDLAQLCLASRLRLHAQDQNWSMCMSSFVNEAKHHYAKEQLWGHLKHACQVSSFSC